MIIEVLYILVGRQEEGAIAKLDSIEHNNGIFSINGCFCEAMGLLIYVYIWRFRNMRCGFYDRIFIELDSITARNSNGQCWSFRMVTYRLISQHHASVESRYNYSSAWYYQRRILIANLIARCLLSSNRLPSFTTIPLFFSFRSAL